MTPSEEHRRVRDLLGTMRDDELRALVAPGRPSRGSWGWSGAAEVDGTAVFVKRVPVTDLEAERWPSTRNHFGLPTHFHYGVGSAGFGAAREAAAHAQASDWVEEGTLDGVARLHHARLLPHAGPRWELPLGRDAYVAMWDGDPAVGAYVDARCAARHELWLVEEHLPHTVADWLVDHQDQVDHVLDRLLAVVRTMGEHGLVHFDAHLQNALVDDDGDRVCLADFGLALSAEADLRADERAFLAAHRHYDLGEVVFSLSSVVGVLHQQLAPDDRAHARRVAEVPDDADRGAELLALVARAGRLADEGLLPLDERYVAALERFRPVIDHVGALLWGLVRDPRKRMRHDDAALVGLLRDCGVDVAA